MNSVPLWAQLLALVFLILCSAFFSISETSLMAANRHRLRHLAKRGSKLAITTLWLVERIDKVLALILIGNTVVNALVAALVTAMAITAFGNDDRVITIATGVVAFLLIIWSSKSPIPRSIASLSMATLRPTIRSC